MFKMDGRRLECELKIAMLRALRLQKVWLLWQPAP